MAWYSVNKLSVTQNSAVVTGNATQFATFVYPGFGIFIEKVPYEIQSVDSATEITLTEPYKGTTRTDANYSIWPTQGINIPLWQTTTELLDTFGPLRNDMTLLTQQIADTLGYKNAAAASATAANTSKTNAATSATNAATSATNAANSATAAAGSATAANTSKTNAANSATAAAGSASDANASKQAASTSAADALANKNATQTLKDQATAARDAAISAQGASEAARDAAAAAEGGAETARDAAVVAKTSAEGARDTALTYRNTAETHKNAAATSATNSANSATASASSKAAAETAKGLAESARDDAAGAATSANTYKADALAAKNEAVTAKNAAIVAKEAAEAAASEAQQIVTVGSIENALGYVPVSPADNQAALNTKLNLTGGTVTGDLTVNGAIFTKGIMRFSRASGEQFRVGYDTGAALDTYFALYQGDTSRTGYIQSHRSSGLILYNDLSAMSLRLGNDGILYYNGDASFTGTLTAPRLRLTSTTDASAGSTTHALQIGLDTSANVIIDTNEIMARNNGAVASLGLNPDGGNVTINGSVAYHAGNIASAPISTATQTALNAKADNSVSVTAGNGLSGGGTLAATRTVTLGTPSTVTNSTTNSVTATSHTHALTITAADVGLGSVNNTSDAAKPISTATQNALNLKANLASPAFTGAVSITSTNHLLLGTSGNQPTAIHRMDGNNYYFLMSNASTGINSAYNSLRPLTIAATTGRITSSNGQAFSGGTAVSGSLTLDGNVVWSSGNDGSGSGADADLLDGQQGTYYRDLANSTGTLPNARFSGTYDGITEMSMTRIRLTTTSDVSLSSTGHAFQLGPTTGLNIAIDDNELQSRNNGAAADFNINLSGGNLVCGANITAYSDRRLKSDIRTIENASELVSKLRGCRYVKDGNEEVGVIAQEVREVLPEVVFETKSEDKILAVSYDNIVAVLIEAVKELQAEIKALKNREEK